LFLPLWAETRESFLLPADHLIQQSCGGTLGLPCGVGVNVHRGTDVGVAQQLLHVLGSRPAGQEAAGERVPLWHNNNTEAGTLDFSGVPAFLVTNVLKVHCSNPNYKGFR